MSDLKKCGYSADVSTDEYADNPRKEWDNASKMVCFHGRYDLGDESHDYRKEDFTSWDGLRKAIVKKERPAAVLPLFLFDHSGITLSVGSADFERCDPQGWDWGQVGWAYVPKRSPDLKGLGKEEAEREAERLIRSEVAVYAQYLEGDVWCVQIYDPEGEIVDSCGGYYGYEYALEEAQRMLDDAVESAGVAQCDPVAV